MAERYQPLIHRTINVEKPNLGQAAKAQTRLSIRAVSTEPYPLACATYGSR